VNARFRRQWEGEGRGLVLGLGLVIESLHSSVCTRIDREDSPSS
jgi:hypothetical protein